MKKVKYIGRILLFAVSLLPFYEPATPGWLSQARILAKTGYFTPPEKYESFADKWKIVAGFDEKGKPRSALAAVEEILALAQKKRNAPQIVKAQIHRVKYLMTIGEKEHPDILAMLENETSRAAFPEKQILQSILADAYWNYFSANRYMFYSRTQTRNFKENDISTWSLDRIFSRIITLYRASLSEPEDLRKIPLGLIDEILVKGNVPRVCRPTLYDFLAHRAVDFFMIEENQLAKPAHDFEIDSADYFKPAEDFARLPITGNDPSSLRYNAALILQDLTRIHLKGRYADPDALAEVELKRLKFALDKAVMQEKDSLYIKALRALENRFADRPCSGLASYEIAQWYRAKGNEWKDGDPDDHQWSIKKSVEIAREVIRRFPDSEAALLCRPLTVIDKSLSIVTEKVDVPSRPFRALVKYKNIGLLYLRTVRLSPGLTEYLGAGNDTNEQKAARLAAMDPVKEWSLSLPDNGDLREHSAEIKIAGLAPGSYALLAGTDKSFSYNKNAVAFMVMAVSNLSFVHRVSPSGGALFYIFSRDRGLPLENVKATIIERRYDYSVSRYVTRITGRLASDKNGFLRFPLGRDRRYYYGDMSIILEKDNDSLKSEFYSHAHGQESPSAHQTYFFTDRSLYRPGQIIYFKAVLLKRAGDKRYAIMPDHETVVELIDYNQQKISSLTLRSNRYGTVSGVFTAPYGVLTGEMTIQNSSGSAVIRVEEYKRPKFEAGFEPVKGNYRLGDTITARGYARSYSGAPLSEAQVRYSVVRRVWFVYRWWGWYFRRFNNQVTVIKKGETRTGAGGEFSVGFAALPDPRIPRSEQPAFYYEIHADVTDVNGETHGADASIRAGYTSLVLDVANLPESIDSGKRLLLELRTANLSAEFVPAKGAVAIFRIKEPERLLRPRLWDKPDRFVIPKKEYITDFPHDIYNDENDIRSRGVDKKFFSADFDTAKSRTAGPGDISNWPDGDYRVAIDTADVNGEKIHYERYFSVYSLKNEPFTQKKLLHLVLLQTSVEPGSDAKLLVGSYARNARLILDIVRKDKTEKRIIRLDSAKKLVTIPVRESDRGNIHYRYALVKYGRLMTGNGTISVPWSNKELKIEFATFRNKLKPGEKEEWRIKVSGSKGEMAAAELAASMYDASLDSLYPHYWYFDANLYFYDYNHFQSNAAFSVMHSNLAAVDWNDYYSSHYREYDTLDLFGTYFYARGRGYRYYKSSRSRGTAMDESVSGAAKDGDQREEAAPSEPEAEKIKGRISAEDKKQPLAAGKREPAAGEVQVRKNLSETAFFYPHLMTNDRGEVIVSFKAPEALTRWKILGFAHTADLKSAVFANELVTQKELMVTPNLPRFFRQGDAVVISSKISNLTEKKLSGRAELFLFDAVTMKPVDREFSNTNGRQDFTVPGKGNAAVSFSVKVPETIAAVCWRVVARAGDFSDGEESALPVLSNRILVTESMPLPVGGNQKKNFQFVKLMNSGKSKTLSHYRLTLEFTSNPVWYAVQALPYLMEFPHECSEQLFSRFYANSLASHIVNSSPRIKAVFDRWRESGALLSNLQKNEELKSVILQETPWLLNGASEEESKKRVAVLFDLNRMAHELDRAFAKLKQMQGASGGWPWFPGLPESRYISQHILAGLAKLRALGAAAASPARTSGMTGKAVAFIDEQMKQDYDYLVRNSVDLKQKHISYIIYHYLYTRSFFKEIPVQEKYKESFGYWKGQAKRYWPEEGPYAKGLAAIALYRFGEERSSAEILESLREHAIYHEELGMYWKENVGGWWWWEAPAENQALLIEAFEEAGSDRKSADAMRTWLLKMKQVQHWGSTKATTDACYALLMGGTNWLSGDRQAEIFINNKKIDPRARGAGVEAGTGYFTVSWNKNEILPEMGAVTVTNGNRNPAWGALYWQYFEQLDTITGHQTPLKLEKRLFRKSLTDKGAVLDPVTTNTRLKPGDKLKVRIILRADRDMDYVHMKDLRAAGVEPENVLSTHRFQDGLYYYESTKDAATHFFIERLPKGTYVFEYPLVVNLRGDFSAGITTVQCMYAPEFTSHSEGIRIRVE